MKIIFKIARAELRNLFYSPIAWVVIVIFFVISAMQFAVPIMNLARIQEVNLEHNPGWEGFEGPLTYKMFAGTIMQFLSYLFMFIPLLTMGVINREFSSGTIKLLDSAPIRSSDIVFGKFLGLVIFILVLLSSIALLFGTGYYSISHAEIGWYLCMLLGFFLLAISYAAIGLYLSCLTNYQIVAGIASFVIFFLLAQIGDVLQQYDFIRDITFFLSIKGRAETILSGLITTRDLSYFLLINALFLGLAILKLKARNESFLWAVKLGRNMIYVIFILGLGYFSSRPGYVGYYDVTRDQINTLDSATQKMFQELDGTPLTVTLYTNLLGKNSELGVPVARNKYVWGFWDKMVRFYPNIKLKYEYYYDIKEGDSLYAQTFPNKDIHQLAAILAKIRMVDTSDFKKPGVIHSSVDLTDEEWMLIMELDYKGKKAFLRTYPGNMPTQENISGTLARLSRTSTPKVLYITGHYERSPYKLGEREYGNRAAAKGSNFALVNLGVDVDTIHLERNDIPSSTAFLVLADPKAELTAAEQQKVVNYLEQGGNAIFYGEPGKQQMLNPMLNAVGVNLDNGILVRPAKHVMAEYFEMVLNHTGNYMAREEFMQRYQRTGLGGAGGYFFSTSTISYQEINGFKVEPILSYAPDEHQTWLENGIFVSDSAAPTFSAAEGDIKKDNYVIGVRLTRTINNKEQRIVVMGDADFMSPHRVNGGSIGNGLQSWLLYNEYPVYTRAYMPTDIFLTIDKAAGIRIYYSCIYVIPGLLILVGSIIVIRRRRK